MGTNAMITKVGAAKHHKTILEARLAALALRLKASMGFPSKALRDEFAWNTKQLMAAEAELDEAIDQLVEAH